MRALTRFPISKIYMLKKNKVVFMKLTIKRISATILLSLCIVSLCLTNVQAASETFHYDTGSETLYDIIATIDSTKVEDGNNTFQVEIKITDLGPNSVYIHEIQIFFRIEPYILDYGSTTDILTANDMSSIATLTFEYNSSWGNVDLDILIKFQEEVYHGEDLITHYYETNWIYIFTLKSASGASWSALSLIVAVVSLGSGWFIITRKLKLRA